jgi:hypothetical protein
VEGPIEPLYSLEVFRSVTENYHGRDVVAARLVAARGFLNEFGKPYAAKSVASGAQFSSMIAGNPPG